MEIHVNTWPVQDAKARFSELIEQSVKQGPQLVTKRGQATAVVVPFSQWQSMAHAAKPALKSLLLERAPEPVEFAVPARGALRLRAPKAF